MAPAAATDRFDRAKRLWYRLHRPIADVLSVVYQPTRNSRVGSELPIDASLVTHRSSAHSVRGATGVAVCGLIFNTPRCRSRLRRLLTGVKHPFAWFAGLRPSLFVFKTASDLAIARRVSDHGRGGLRTHDLRISQVRGSAGLMGADASKAVPHRISVTL